MSVEDKTIRNEGGEDNTGDKGGEDNTGDEGENEKTTSLSWSEQLQSSYVQKIPSFERDDDLTVVTTAESTSTSVPNLHRPAVYNQGGYQSNRSDQGIKLVDHGLSQVSGDSSSVNQGNAGNDNNNSPRSSLAAAAAGFQSFNLQNNQSKPNVERRSTSSLASALAANADSFNVKMPPPGLASPTSTKREKVVFRNNQNYHSYSTSNNYYNRNNSATFQYNDVAGNNRYRGSKHNFHDTTDTNLIFRDNRVWGSSPQEDFNDSLSYPSMPSVAAASSHSQSTSSFTTNAGAWKKNVHSRLEKEKSSLRRKQWNNTSTVSSGEFSSSSLPLPHRQYLDERLGDQTNNRSQTFQSLSNSNQSYSGQRGRGGPFKDFKLQKDDNVPMGSRSVHAIMSAPNILLQPGGLYSADLQVRSSSSHSSSYHSVSEGLEGSSSQRQTLLEPIMFEEPKETTALSFAIPPIDEIGENMKALSFNEKENAILPSFQERDESQILPGLSSGESDENSNSHLDEYSKNVSTGNMSTNFSILSHSSRKREWRLKMMRKLSEIPVGELNPEEVPIAALMNEWAKTKSVDGANKVEMLLNRANAEVRAGNAHTGVQLSTKMYTIAVDAWAKSKAGEKAALRAESILQHMNDIYQSTKNRDLKPTTGIFNAVVNAWAQSKDKKAASRCEQILDWMDSLYRNGNVDVKPDTYTYNTCMHALAQNGDKESATKALGILENMYEMYKCGNLSAKPETISFNIVINSLAKSKEKGAATEAEKLLYKMQMLHDSGELDVKPNVVSYCAVIDAYAKSMEKGAASKGDLILANMIQLYQSDPVTNADLRPNTHVFNTLINCWSKSTEDDAASRAEEVLVAMSDLQENGTPGIKPDSFSYTAVIDAWAKSGHSGAALRAEALLEEMELKYMAGDIDLKPTTYTYNAVIHSLAKSGEVQAASRAEKVLQNMVNRYRAGGTDVMPTTINFNTVLGAWAKSNSGRSGAERAEKVLTWMDDLRNSGNTDIKPDTISFNACIDAWARSGYKKAAERAEQILRHMDQLYAAGNEAIKADSYSYNTVLNAWAKSGLNGAPQRAERILSIMQAKYRNGDISLKPNTRTYTTVVDTWAKSNERNAARKAEEILVAMQSEYERTNDDDAKPNTATANAVMNSCAFTKVDSDKHDALTIAFRVFDWLSSQVDIAPDAYTYTIMLSVCSNLLPRQDTSTRYSHARKLFLKCRESGYVNDFVLRKLRHTVTEEEYMSLVDYRVNSSARNLPASWTRNISKNKSRNRSKGSKWNRR